MFLLKQLEKSWHALRFPVNPFLSLKVVHALGEFFLPQSSTIPRRWCASCSDYSSGEKIASCMDYSSKNGLTGNLNAASFSSSPLAKTSLVKCLLTLLYVTTITCRFSIMSPTVTRSTGVIPYSDTALAVLVKGLPEMLLRQYEYEDPIVRGGKHLLHSAFFKVRKSNNKNLFFSCFCNNDSFFFFCTFLGVGRSGL